MRRLVTPITRCLFALLVLLVASALSAPLRAVPQSALAQTVHQDSTVKVWVNTSSGIYHCPGTRYYGATKAGIYLSEQQARAKGYHPAGRRTCAVRTAAALAAERVWVNTRSGVYHCAGSRYYGTTKAGKYLSEAEARKAGYHPANNRPCAGR